jgi:hypothetical protein
MTDSLPDFTYDDDAEIIAGQERIPVRAVLRKKYGKLGEEWGGHLHAASGNAFDLTPVHYTDEPILRMPDGQEASFAVQGSISNPLPIRGNPPAPF